VIAGPSGVGKGSVVRRLLEAHPGGLALSISATTRPPREGEVDERDYRFVSTDAFRRMVERGELLEWAEVFGHLYGTPASAVEEHRRGGRDVLLEIDVQGANQVRLVAPDAILVLLEPPSLGELERRLRGRGTEVEATIAERLSKAEWELSQRDRFDHVVVNDDLERASSQVAAIIEASRSAPGPGRSDPEDPPA
jgi:guanylate kinase